MAETQNERPINLNTASPEQLAELPGVGPTLALRITRGRPYRSAEDLIQVSGVGQRLLDRISEHVTVEAPAPAEAPARGRPAMPSRAPETPGTGIRAGNALLLSLSVGLASALVAVGLTLGVLLAINGTLNVGRHARVQALSQEVAALQSNLGDLDRQLASMEQRLAALDGLSGRMASVEGEVDSLRQEAEAAAASVDQMRSTVDALQRQMSALTARADRFDSFLSGLRRLLSADTSPDASDSEGVGP